MYAREATAEEVLDYEEQRHRDDENPDHIRRAWRTGGRLALGLNADAHAGLDVGRSVGGLFDRLRVLGRPPTELCRRDEHATPGDRRDRPDRVETGVDIRERQRGESEECRQEPG